MMELEQPTTSGMVMAEYMFHKRETKMPCTSTIASLPAVGTNEPLLPPARHESGFQ